MPCFSIDCFPRKSDYLILEGILNVCIKWVCFHPTSATKFYLKKLVMYTYKIHLHKESEGGYTVSVPSLPGLITYGENVDEAISMAKEAVELSIEELQSRGEEVHL